MKTNATSWSNTEYIFGEMLDEDIMQCYTIM